VSKTSELQNLKKQLKKTWSKIGQRKQHTNSRLIEHNILKLDDELRINESKVIWRWEMRKLPRGLRDILIEIDGHNLRNQKFSRPIAWKNNSLANRFATLATKSIDEISIARSKKGLCKKLRKKCHLIDYAIPCRIRNCQNCTQ
jgi:hypothetical protein